MESSSNLVLVLLMLDIAFSAEGSFGLVFRLFARLLKDPFIHRADYRTAAELPLDFNCVSLSG